MDLEGEDKRGVGEEQEEEKKEEEKQEEEKKEEEKKEHNTGAEQQIVEKRNPTILGSRNKSGKSGF